MIEGVMTTEEKAICSIAPVTSTGKPAILDGIPTWVAEDPSGILGPLVVSADGMSCEVPSADEVTGTGAIVTVLADADLGDGVVTITEGFIFTVNHAMATSLRGGIQVVSK